MMRQLQLACLAASTAALLLTASPAAAGKGCVSFSNLEHCPIGKAGLALSGETLQISGTGAEGQDGVAVTLSDARDWQAGVRFSDGDSSPRVALGASAGGEEISRAEIVTTDDGTHLSATFTGSDGPGTYSILVYRDGTLVGSQGGVDASRYLNIDEWFDLYWELWDLIGFQNRMANGACVWTFGFSEALRLTLPDGVEVEGDAVELVEEVGDGAGHYPYVAFDGITLRSSRDLQITSEEAQ